MLHPGRTGRNHLRMLAARAGVAARARGRAAARWSTSQARPTGAPAATRSACASGSASPPRCSATRACSCSTSRPTASTRRASAGCATSCASLAAEGRAVLVSSHVLAEVSQTADEVVVIARGRSVAQAPLDGAAGRRAAAACAWPARTRGASPSSCGRSGASVDAAGDGAIVVHDRTGEQIGRLVAEHRSSISELVAGLLLARGDLLPSSPARRRRRHDPADRRRAAQAAQHPHRHRPDRLGRRPDRP